MHNLGEQIFPVVKAHLKDRMKVHIGVDMDSGFIHSVKTTPANVHDLMPAAELLHRDEEVAYSDAGYQGIEKRPEMESKTTTFRIHCHATGEMVRLARYS
jgi:IS5 family transposase